VDPAEGFEVVVLVDVANDDMIEASTPVRRPATVDAVLDLVLRRRQARKARRRPVCIEVEWVALRDMMLSHPELTDTVIRVVDPDPSRRRRLHDHMIDVGVRLS